MGKNTTLEGFHFYMSEVSHDLFGQFASNRVLTDSWKFQPDTMYEKCVLRHSGRLRDKLPPSEPRGKCHKHCVGPDGGDDEAHGLERHHFGPLGVRQREATLDGENGEGHDGHRSWKWENMARICNLYCLATLGMSHYVPFPPFNHLAQILKANPFML